MDRLRLQIYLILRIPLLNNHVSEDSANASRVFPAARDERPMPSLETFRVLPAMVEYPRIPGCLPVEVESY
jgi:hypothetical protein